jgi:NAD(P)-dependent dehydrogenase (short-subunit alcohol dehydrogenase family)
METMGNLLDGKVIIVTGGGPGVGRGIALAAARAGADVIVNDIGVGPGGEIEPASGPGQDVVNEIGAFGAGAAACTESVSTWPSAQKIIQAALDHFGRIDGVVNNAGILRDTIFHKLPPKISISWSTSISKVRSMSAAPPRRISRHRGPAASST